MSSAAVTAIFNKILESSMSSFKDQEVTGLKFSGHYQHRVVNTHCAPRGKPTNFMCTEDLPRYYPGLNGRVWLKVRIDSTKWSSMFDFSHHTLLHTGSGGAGSYDGPFTLDTLDKDEYNCSYYAKVFLDDFPEMQALDDEWVHSLDQLKKNIMRDKLSGQRTMVLHTDEHYDIHHQVPIEFFWQKS